MNVVAKFAYYQEWPEMEPFAIYRILKSDNEKLTVLSDISQETLAKFGVAIPLTPTFQTWINIGKPIYRGREVLL